MVLFTFYFGVIDLNAQETEKGGGGGGGYEEAYVDFRAIWKA